MLQVDKWETACMRHWNMYTYVIVLDQLTSSSGFLPSAVPVDLDLLSSGPSVCPVLLWVLCHPGSLDHKTARELQTSMSKLCLVYVCMVGVPLGTWYLHLCCLTHVVSPWFISALYTVDSGYCALIGKYCLIKRCVLNLASNQAVPLHV